jgi:hypothetical protein
MATPYLIEHGPSEKRLRFFATAPRQKKTGNCGALPVPSPSTLGVAYWMKLSGNVAPQ